MSWITWSLFPTKRTLCISNCRALAPAVWTSRSPEPTFFVVHVVPFEIDCEPDAVAEALRRRLRAFMVDTRPEGTDRTGDDTPKMFHYVRKSKIAESAVLGNLVVALCGETFPVTRSPKPGSPVCPECKEIYESLPQGGDA